MDEEDQVPVWARELAEAMAETIEFGALTFLDCEQSGPEETEWGVDLVEMWPALMEIQEVGPNDGELIYGIIQRFDVLAAQKIFDQVDSMVFGYAFTGQPEVKIEAWFGGRPVVVIVYFEPNLEDEDDDNPD